MNSIEIGCDYDIEANLAKNSPKESSRSPRTVILKPKSASQNPYYLSQVAAAQSRHRREINEGK